MPVQEPSPEHVPSQGQAASKTPSTGRAVMLKHICSLCTCLPEPILVIPRLKWPILALEHIFCSCTCSR